MMKLNIIIPAYNEEKRITPTLKAYLEHFDKLQKHKLLDYEITVVINKSNDKTEEIVKGFEKTHKNLSHIHLSEKGKGLALIEGFKLALKGDADLIGFVDADMATRPDEYEYLVAQLIRLDKREIPDGVIASRYLEDAIVDPKPTFQRWLASRVYNLWICTLFFLNYRDTQCGAKIFSRKALKKVINQLTVTNWAVDIDILYCLKKNGFKVKEVPTVWSDKTYSKINFLEAGPYFILATIRLRLLYSPFKFVVKFYDWITT